MFGLIVEFFNFPLQPATFPLKLCVRDTDVAQTVTRKIRGN